MADDVYSHRLARLRLVLFAFGTLYSLFCALCLTAPAYRQKFESTAIAASLVANGSFANPYQMAATGPTAHLPPVYPAFLSIFFWLFKDDSDLQYLALSVITALMYGLAAACLPSLAAKVFHKRFVGIFASSALVALPIFQVLPGSETVPLSLCLIVFCAVSLSPIQRPWLLGLLAATISLLNVPAVLFIATWSAGLVLVKRLTARTVGWACLLCFGLCLPWMVRNLIMVGSFCIRDNFGLELQLSNNDHAQPLVYESLKTSHTLYHPNVSRSEAIRVKTLGEAEYNRQKTHEAIVWIKTHPLDFARLTFQHFLFFWFPDQRLIFGLTMGFLTLISLPGVLMASRRLGLDSILLAATVAYSLPYMVVVSDLRYRTPIMWVSVLFAGQTVQMAGEWIPRLRARQSSNSASLQSQEHDLGLPPTSELDPA